MPYLMNKFLKQKYTIHSTTCDRDFTCDETGISPLHDLSHHIQV